MALPVSRRVKLVTSLAQPIVWLTFVKIALVFLRSRHGDIKYKKIIASRTCRFACANLVVWGCTTISTASCWLLLAAPGGDSASRAADRSGRCQPLAMQRSESGTGCNASWMAFREAWRYARRRRKNRTGVGHRPVLENTGDSNWPKVIQTCLSQPATPDSLIGLQA